MGKKSLPCRGEKPILSRDKRAERFETLIELFFEQCIRGGCQQLTAIRIRQDAAQFFNASQKLVLGPRRFGVAGQHELNRITKAPYRSTRLIRMNRIPQPKYVGIGSDDRQSTATVSVFDDRAVDKHSFAGAEF
ncbi:hypothetical protein AL036_13450 [Salipiger aestuarii]|nr:hypothetical protein AL036_13450 [Salipiger aestuarii]KAB2541345.1 hypothetical protein AL035_12820 [Salipiger aestuarii]